VFFKIHPQENITVREQLDGEEYFCTCLFRALGDATSLSPSAVSHSFRRFVKDLATALTCAMDNLP
jgi:hypothetical protein